MALVTSALAIVVNRNLHDVHVACWRPARIGDPRPGLERPHRGLCARVPRRATVTPVRGGVCGCRRGVGAGRAHLLAEELPEAEAACLPGAPARVLLREPGVDRLVPSGDPRSWPCSCRSRCSAFAAPPGTSPSCYGRACTRNFALLYLSTSSRRSIRASSTPSCRSCSSLGAGREHGVWAASGLRARVPGR